MTEQQARQLVILAFTLHPAQGEVRGILAVLTSIAAQFEKRRFQRVVQGDQFRRAFADPRPDDTRPAWVGEAADALDRQGELLLSRAARCDRPAYPRQVALI